jgi:hypothetical protein
VQELHNSVMIIVREHDHIGPHVVHNHREPLEHRVYELTGEIGEVLILSLPSRKQPGLNLAISSISHFQHFS